MTGAESLAALATEHLLTASIQGGVVLVCVWVVTRRHAGLRPSVQAWLWWLASLKLLVLLAGVPGVPVPVLPLGAPAPSRGQHETLPALAPWSHVAAGASVPVAAAAEGFRPPVRVAPVERAATRQWPASVDPRVALIMLWGAGVATAFGHLFLSFRRMRRCVARSHAIGPEGQQLAFAIASRVGLRRAPDVRISHEVHAPQVAGVWRPVIMIPASAGTQWTREDLRMALCHELAHVRRRDLLYGWIPVLASRLFFFHPLAHLATREYLLAREAACDALVLQTLQAEPAPYGRLLLRLGAVKPQSALAAGGTSATASGLKRRLEMLNRASFTVPAAHRWLIAAAVSLALVPLDLVSRAEASPENGAPARAAESDRQLRARQSPSTVAAERPQGPSAPANARADRLQERSVERAQQDSRGIAIRVPDSGGATTARKVERSVVPEGRSVRRAAREQEAGVRQPQAPAGQETSDAERRAREDVARDALREELRAEQRRADLLAQLQSLRAKARYAELAMTLELRSSDAFLATSTLDFLNNQIAQVESELAAQAQATGDIDSLAGERARPLEDQMRTLDAQLEMLTRQQDALARQQEALVEAQREIAMQLQRVRDVLEQLRRSRETPEP